MKFGLNFSPSFRLSDMSTAEYFAQCLAPEWEPVRPGGDDGAAWCTMV